MLAVVLSLAIVFGLLLISELLWQLKIVRGEPARKAMHVSIGAFIAFWPYVMSYTVIDLICLAFLLVVYLSRSLSVFHAIHDVKRQTWGELLYPIGIGGVALIHPASWIFTVAILHLSIADGLAAVVGSKWGKANRYKVFGEVKSLAGTVAFLVTSVIIVSCALALHWHTLSGAIAALALLPILSSSLEGLGTHGLDNVLVPFSVALVLIGITI